MACTQEHQNQNYARELQVPRVVALLGSGSPFIKGKVYRARGSIEQLHCMCLKVKKKTGVYIKGQAIHAAVWKKKVKGQ